LFWVSLVGRFSCQLIIHGRFWMITEDGRYTRRDKATGGDIDIAFSFAMKTETKLNRRIQYYVNRDGVDRKGAYKAIGEVSDSIIRSKHFDEAASDYKTRVPVSCCLRNAR
jgi:hypothetical protein